MHLRSTTALGLRLSLFLGTLAFGFSSVATATPPTSRPASPPTSRPATPSLTPAMWLQKGKDFLASLQKGRFQEIYATFDKPMQSAMSPGTLQQFWTMLNLQVGAMEEVFESEVLQASPVLWIVLLDIRFKAMSLTMRVVFRDNQQVAGFNIRPFAARKSALPPYAQAEKFVETKLTLGKEWPLAGKLTIPKGQGAGPWPAVVLVHGSGPHDEDESIGFFKPFRDLAAGLSSRGVVVLRYVKRTHAKAHGLRIAKEKMATLTLFEETIEDAANAARFLQGHKDVDPKRIVIVGHSLGGIAAPRIAKEVPFVGGLILMAGTPRPLEDVVLDQVQYIFGLEKTISEEKKAHLALLKGQVALVKSPTLAADTPASQLPLSLPAQYWLDLRKNPPGPAIAKLDLPILVLQGERDYQVLPTKDYEQWKFHLKGNKRAMFVLFPKLNHLFVAGEGKGTPQDYQGKGFVEGSVVETIASWLSSLASPTKKKEHR